MKSKSITAIIILIIFTLLITGCSNNNSNEAYLNEPLDELGDPLEENSEAEDKPDKNQAGKDQEKDNEDNQEQAESDEKISVPSEEDSSLDKNGISLRFFAPTKESLTNVLVQKIQVTLGNFEKSPLTFPPLDEDNKIKPIKFNVGVHNKKTSDPAKVSVWSILRIHYGDNEKLLDHPTEQELQKYLFKDSEVYIDKESKDIVVKTLVGTKRLSVGEDFTKEGFTINISKNTAAKDLTDYYTGNKVDLEMIAVGINDSSMENPNINDKNRYTLKLAEEFISDNLVFEKRDKELTLVGIKDESKLEEMKFIQSLNKLDIKNGGEYKVVSIGENAITDLDIRGDISELNISLETIQDNALANTSLTGILPYFPTLRQVGKDILINTSVQKNSDYKNLISDLDVDSFSEGNKRWVSE